MHYLKLIKLFGTSSFVSAIANFVSLVAEEITQSADQVKMRLNSQLFKDSSRVFKKLRKYFNVTAILTSFLLPADGVFSCYFYFEFKWSTITTKINNIGIII